ncbi:syntaxin-binding protein 5 isoform x2 [Limosa lapponica baueri]|uniref:Syntaxin-binding protein 5 isoform x2 n=1 Tax=Limosa lapponica baueri TaxID=1758121 RepID=A0A2I0TKC5_LIMLA|nr:syntaxin-binding protein 5 isoform x2 [Limosa lapponica baueri]
MRKFNIRKVLDGLTAVSAVASASSAAQQQQAGNRETEIQETLQSEHFQLCKCCRRFCHFCKLFTKDVEKTRAVTSIDFIHCEILRVAEYACNFSEVKGVYQKFAMCL